MRVQSVMSSLAAPGKISTFAVKLKRLKRCSWFDYCDAISVTKTLGEANVLKTT